MKRMKIAYILPSLANSGPVIVAQDLAKVLVAHGHQVEVFYFDDRVELKFPCRTTRISMGSSFDFRNFDVVHCHGFRPDVFAALHKPLRCKTPVCTTIHSYMFSDHVFKRGRVLGNITARMVLASTFRDDKVITLSQNMRDYYSDYLPNAKLTFAYNSRECDSELRLSDEEEAQLLQFKGDSPLLCSVSGLNRRKGLLQIINVLQLLDGFKYCVVGDGPERTALEEQASRLGVRERVLFVGSKPKGYRYLRYADIFVMPSYSEGFPLAMLEAASLGKAAVCSDIPIFKEIFTDEEVIRFKLDDTNSLCKAILRGLEYKETLSKNIKARYENSYSLDSFYKRHIEIYNELIERKHGKG